MDRQSFENEIVTKDKEINQLVEEIQRLQGCLTKLQESSMSQITILEDQLEQKRQQIVRLENKLDLQKDYEEMKREIRLGVEQQPPQTPNLSLTPPILPPPFQNVDAFGSLLGEEIVSSWRRNIEHNRVTPKSPSASLDVPLKSSTPVNADSTAEKSTASTPQPSEHGCQQSPNENLVNGNPKSPQEDNNNHHVSNNNISLSAMCAVNNFLRNDDSLKSPYRFDEHRGPFKFAEDLGMAPGSMVGRLGESLIPKGDPMEARLQEMLRYNIDKYATQNLVLGVEQQPPQTPNLSLTPPILPPPFQNVDAFGSLLGEEIVSSWRRNIEHNRVTPKSPSASLDVPLKSSTPVNADSTAEKSTASTPQPSEHGCQQSPNENLVNGNPKSPQEDNNNHHVSNNNISLSAMCAVNNFLRNDDSLKSPYRFDEHRGPFKFAEDLGMAPGSMVGRLGESLIPKGDPMEARLQEMLRYNIDKYATQNLDTLHISRRVRELLSIHNIGQRLFAKYILGLSQGTVSELLSKPKPWDKLTEKGRDSYRKMHAWACDENAILLLKSLIPKKDHFSSTGVKSEPGMTPYGRPDNDHPEDRLVHILNDPNFHQHMKQPPPEDSHSNEDSKSPQGCSSPFSRDSSMNKRLKKYENDDISQDKVVRIYQEELAKLMGRRIEDFRGPRDGPFPGFFLPQLYSGNSMERTPEDLRMVLDAYHREFAKLNHGQNPTQMPLSLLAIQQQALAHHHQQQQQQQQQHQQQHLNSNGGVQDLSIPKDKMKMVNGGMDDKEKDDDHVSRHSGSAFSLVRPKIEPGTQPNTGSTASSPLGNSILPPMTPTDDFSGSAAASPLQRMASITNSLISQPTTPHHPSSNNRPLKAVLPPITQQQFDLYNNLNTEDIVKKVKEQLSQYSISQRLFGESVLGLSQGSVSDLLARPKPWHMLTQKGREPFIRMKMFLEDDNAVHKLVASQYKIAPEKLMRTGGYGGGVKSEPGMTPYGRPDNDHPEDRLVHILNDPNFHQHMKQPPPEDSHSNEDSKSPQGCSSPFSRDSSMNKRLKKYENDDISQDKVVRIYQEELAKLMGRRIEDFRGPRDGPFPGGNSMERTPEDLRMVLDAYHREFAKLNHGQNPTQMPLSLLAIQQQALAHHHQQQQQQQQQHQQQHLNSNGGVQDLSIPKDKMKMVNGGMDDKEKDDDHVSRHSGSAFSLVRPKIEPGTQPNTGSTASSPLGNSILPPMTPTDDFSGSAAASPLQRMASITNSLISQPTTPHHPSSNNRPLKAVLPPITQQQFDLYNNLNTEDIVKKVKEQLSQYSISQRLFGESVLGLSQGSVSDLLARPKPWHMLTQKGREPFIRMKMFLEDDNAVHKLVASQYKIAPEKLMRTGGYGGAAGLLNKMQESQNILPPSLQLGPPQGVNPQPPPPPMLLTPPGLPPHHAISLQNPDLMKKANHSPHGIPHSPMGQQHASLRNMHQHISPSVYEMAALTQDLDTQVITTKIKEALLANNIGQKIFGEAVLGLSQGSVSELLSKPKPWHMLSIKGREPFIRMQLWLNDAHNVDRLQALKNERREANKRRRSSGAGAHDNSSDTSSNDTSEFYHSNSPGPGPPSAKKLDLSALNNAVKEQMSGLDLSMPSLKREPGDYDDDDDVESNVGSEDSNMSGGSLHGEVKTEPKELPTNQGRTSRRKPAAPQWVNPNWEEEKEKVNTGDEVIINGVCVMQTGDDYGRRSSEETVRVEPQAVMDRFEEDQSDASSISNDHEQTEKPEVKEEEQDEHNESENKTEDSENKNLNQENEEERWEY
uniref:LOW QUALITY PROTEIN: homeobox protein cut-like n=1 Tax=Diabrotica virgifera virgifera TaxID=50390 RepID=A0A6P7FNG3_DIAVI